MTDLSYTGSLRNEIKGVIDKMRLNIQSFMTSIFVMALMFSGLKPVTAKPIKQSKAFLIQSHEEINQAVTRFVLQQRVPLNDIQVNITSLNQQIRLRKCDKKLKVSIAAGAKLLGHASLAVSCSAPQAWKIHVAAHIDGIVNALITRYPIPRGTVIQETDIEFSPRRYSQLHYGYYSSATHLRGMETKRNLKAGQVLTPGLVKAPKLVLRGQNVIIVAQTGNLNLRVKGKALMDGQQGQTIKVKNLSSKKLIFARVISAGTVKVNF